MDKSGMFRGSVFGGYNKDDVLDYITKIEAENEQIKVLHNKELENLKKDSKEYEQLKEDYARVSEQVEVYQNEKSRSAEKLEELKKENDRLFRQVSELKQENERLRHRIEELEQNKGQGGSSSRIHKFARPREPRVTVLSKDGTVIASAGYDGRQSSDSGVTITSKAGSEINPSSVAAGGQSGEEAAMTGSSAANKSSISYSESEAIIKKLLEDARYNAEQIINDANKERKAILKKTLIESRELRRSVCSRIENDLENKGVKMSAMKHLIEKYMKDMKLLQDNLANVYDGMDHLVDDMPMRIDGYWKESDDDEDDYKVDSELIDNIARELLEEE